MKSVLCQQSSTFNNDDRAVPRIPCWLRCQKHHHAEDSQPGLQCSATASAGLAATSDPNLKVPEAAPPLRELQVPAVASEPRVKFLKNFPRVGGYCAVAVPYGPAGPSSGCFQAVLAADSLLPEGHGQALSAGDVTVLWDIAQALGKALDAAAAVKRWAPPVQCYC